MMGEEKRKSGRKKEKKEKKELPFNRTRAVAKDLLNRPKEKVPGIRYIVPG